MIKKQKNGKSNTRSDSQEKSSFVDHLLALGKDATGLLSLGALYPWQSNPGMMFAFETEDIRSLVRYASEEGIDPDLVANTYKNLKNYEKLRSPDDTDELNTARVELLKSYTKLCNATKSENGNVTGRTVRDSMRLPRHTRRLVYVTFGCLFWGLMAATFNLYFQDVNVAPKDTLASVFWHFHTYGLNILSPFFWGGLGACIYILKRSYDAARNHTFDTETFGGWTIRVVLGFVLGGAVLYIIDPETLGASGTVIAFLTGLSTKIVYGALEKTILEISSRFQLDNMQSGRKSSNIINEYLAKELGTLDPKKDKEKYNVLVSLMKDR